MAKEKVKIRAGEFEEHEIFKYKGGLFKVLRNFEQDCKVLVIKPRRIKGNVSTPVAVGKITTFSHNVMVQRYNKKPKKETLH